MADKKEEIVSFVVRLPASLVFAMDSERLHTKVSRNKQVRDLIEAKYPDGTYKPE